MHILSVLVKLYLSCTHHVSMYVCVHVVCIYICNRNNTTIFKKNPICNGESDFGKDMCGYTKSMWGLCAWPVCMACGCGLCAWPVGVVCVHGLCAWPVCVACVRGL